MINNENINNLREIYMELLKLTGITGGEDWIENSDKRLLEHINLYFKRINKHPIYKNKSFK